MNSMFGTPSRFAFLRAHRTARAESSIAITRAAGHLERKRDGDGTGPRAGFGDDRGGDVAQSSSSLANDPVADTDRGANTPGMTTNVRPAKDFVETPPADRWDRSLVAGARRCPSRRPEPVGGGNVRE